MNMVTKFFVAGIYLKIKLKHIKKMEIANIISKTLEILVTKCFNLTANETQ